MRKRKMLISVITPTFNNCNFLKANIESLLTQSNKNYEHIVVDGASNDGTTELLRNYSTIKWISEPDNGMYDAINKGITMASGDIFAYLNADDRYYPYTLEIVAEIFKKYPNIDFIYGYCTYIDENEKILYTFRALPWIPQLVKKSRYTWAQQSCFWKREIHEKIGLLDDTLKYLADRDFFERIIRHGFNGKLLQKRLAKFMVRKASLERALTSRQVTENIILTKRYIRNPLHPYFILNEMLFKFMNIDTYVHRSICKLKREAVI